MTAVHTPPSLDSNLLGRTYDLAMAQSTPDGRVVATVHELAVRQRTDLIQRMIDCNIAGVNISQTFAATRG